MHVSRVLHLQEPADDGKTLTSPQQPPSFPHPTGSNNLPLGQRQPAHALGASLVERFADSSHSDGDSGGGSSGPVQLGFITMPLQSAYEANPPLTQQRSLPSIPARLFQSLEQSNDQQLFDYLSSRHITVGFLREIDQFLRQNPELYYYARDWTQKFNALQPLDAYKYFLKGYTKPARYVPGFLPDPEMLTLPQYFIPGRLEVTYDEELVEFFEGVPFRHDILQEIDRLVDGFCYQIQCGMNPKTVDRKLVVYALYGNPIDAYKYYEYNYQRTWLKHRYLPEHIELDKIPKADNYTLPSPSVIGPDEGHRSHYPTRMRMARAQDDGVDVLDVLMQEFVSELAKKGHRRKHIADMKRHAQEALDQERSDPQGYDIVDLVMNIADSEPRRHRSTPHDIGLPYMGRQPFLSGKPLNPGISMFAPLGGGTLHIYPSNGFVMSNDINTEPCNPLNMKKQTNKATKLLEKKRKTNYTSAKSNLATARKQELLLLSGDMDPKKIKLARRTRIAAERHLAGTLLALNKTRKRLSAQESNGLQKLQCFQGKGTKQLMDQEQDSAEYLQLIVNLTHCEDILS